MYSTFACFLSELGIFCIFSMTLINDLLTVGCMSVAMTAEFKMRSNLDDLIGIFFICTKMCCEYTLELLGKSNEYLQHIFLAME